MHVIGVDFSGATDERKSKTYLAQGWLEGNNLTLASSRSVSRDQLTGILRRARGPVVAAMDFPFSVPAEFARFWQPDVVARGATMPDLWAASSSAEFQDFDDLAEKFVARYGELKRDADPPESLSPLKKPYLNMRPMTFRGMRLLNSLWTDGNTVNPIVVPPLPHPSRKGGEFTTTLLEVMPGAVLRGLGSPFNGYKSGGQARETRRQILNQLMYRLSKQDLQLRVSLSPCREQCLDNDDALDAVVAAITAALWHEARGIFRHPVGQELQVAQLEGWLYAPQNPAG